GFGDGEELFERAGELFLGLVLGVTGVLDAVDEDLAFGETELLHGVVIGGGATGENYGGSGRGGDEERFHGSLDLEISGRCREVGGDRREGEGNASEISRVWRGIG